MDFTMPSIDGCDISIKQETDFEIEDNNDNYLKLDFEIGVKVENDSPTLDDWCLQNTEYQDAIIYEDIKEECEIHTCFLCFRMFADSSSLYQHNLEHLNVVLTEPYQIFQCDYCSSFYTKKLKLIKHIQTQHFLMLRNNTKPLSHSKQLCIICNKTFSYNNWHNHMREVHSMDRIKCSYCEATFKCWTYLRRHVLYVHGSTKPSWRCHKVLEEEIKCDFCPSVFRNRSSRTTHIRNCHSMKVHECKICHSKLKSRPYLLAHMRRVHFDDGKIHRCDICYKEFKSPRYLKIHKKNSHYVRVKMER